MTPAGAAQSQPEPLLAGRFGVVVTTIRDHGRVAGFQLARDVLFSKYELFRKSMPAPAVLKLALEMDRHAMMCEVHADRARASADASVWQEYQRYLAGEIDVAPAVGGGSGPAAMEAEGGRVEVTSPEDLPDGEDEIENDEELQEET